MFLKKYVSAKIAMAVGVVLSAVGMLGAGLLEIRFVGIFIAGVAVFFVGVMMYFEERQ